MEGALFLLRVALGREGDVLRAALGLRSLSHGTRGPGGELYLLAATRDAGALRATADGLGALPGVQDVAWWCADPGSVPGEAPAPGVSYK